MTGVHSGADLDDVRVDPREWPVFLGGVVSSSGRGSWGASFFVLWMVPGTIQAVLAGSPLVPMVAITVVYAAVYLVIWWRAAAWAPRLRVPWLVLLFAVGVGYLVLAGRAGALSEMGYALAAAALLLPQAVSRVVGLVVIVGGMAGYWLLAHMVVWTDALILSLILIVLMAVGRLRLLVHRLSLAREEIRVLAVAGERARLARDLHDVLGHSLTTITVKTALARRLLESGADTERVRDELRDTEDLSRRALADIRATVSGQRRMSLAAELVVARAALRAAGIEADLPHAVDDVAAALEEPFAYVLREGVTNVVRHSGAGHCAVRLGRTWLEIRDDGAGEGVAREGNGLTGLRERLAAVGGTLVAGRRPGGGYQLRAEAGADPGARAASGTGAASGAGAGHER